MRNPFVHSVGAVISADIAVPDHEREVKFYASILTTGDTPLWREDLMNNQGTPVIGLGARIPEYEKLPLQWMPHFQVADVADSAACAVRMGGKELMHSKTDDGQSQWAVLVDHAGAAFGVIPVVPGESDSTPQEEPVGNISWLSLTVSDAVSIRDFYQHVVGWTARSIETTGSEGETEGFEMQINDELSAAEIRELRRDQRDFPSVWMIHLPVGDLAESLRRVTENGGMVVKRFDEAKCAVVRDPVGVCLALQASE